MTHAVEPGVGGTRMPSEAADAGVGGGGEPLTVPLDSVTRVDVARVGGKAAALGELRQAGYRVPNGFIVTTAAFRQVVAANATDELSIPGDVADAIREQLRTLDSKVAVRSSGVAEDSRDTSFAGQYTTILGVIGPEATIQAVADCMASAFSDRVSAYSAGPTSELAVLVQSQVDADAAGVAFTADPLTGARDAIIINSVTGLADRLVSGQADPDIWRVRSGAPEAVEDRDGSLTGELAQEIAEIAAGVEELFGLPQDIEWATKDGRVFVIQARPITALPEEVTWESKEPGAWLRNLRLGEWIGEPMTPSFDTWLLSRLERGFLDQYKEWFGFRVPPPPHHQNVNGWYFGGFPLPSTIGGFAEMLGRLLWRAARDPKRASAALPPLAGYGMKKYVAEWQETLLPGYEAAVREAAEKVPAADPASLMTTIDRLGDLAGRYFASFSVVGGYGWKTELPLARFYNMHLAPTMGGSHQTLLSGLTPRGSVPPHSVQSLDWYRPTFGEMPEKASSVLPVPHDQSERRKAAETSARKILESMPRKARKFDKLLGRAQEASRLRDEHASQFTLPWPVMRLALERISTVLKSHQIIDDANEIYFLTREEIESSLNGHEPSALSQLAATRRKDWDRQRTLIPPESLGPMPRMLKAMLAQADSARSGTVPDGAIKGYPASPGRVTAPARVITSLADSDRLQVGEILIAPLTTPAWTPLFRRAAAVVTDVGSVISHASLVAREYGLPAVVGTGDGTTRIRDGVIVTVDGSAGFVEPAGGIG